MVEKMRPGRALCLSVFRAILVFECLASRNVLPFFGWEVDQSRGAG